MEDVVMPVSLGIILVVVALICFFNNLSLRSDLKWAKEHIELLKSSNNQLADKLKSANVQIEKLTCGNEDTQNTKIPSFLLADDPMDALLRDVGKM